MAQDDEARRLLREVFGHGEFRDGQAAVVRTLLQGRSALAVFPTGGGKSLCYQLPALLLDGLTVVVSPLIALMKDQVDALTRRGVAAARLDSSLDAAGTRASLTAVRSGATKILYVSPERIVGGRFRSTLAGRPIALLAVDEAHCISEWGHNFRPEYLKLAAAARDLKVGRVLALTATATPEVARDVARAFGVAEADVTRTGFERPNLELHATPCRDDADRRARLLDRLNAGPPAPAIVYVTLQRTAEDLADFLRDGGVDAVAYHAGLADDRRHQIQDAFMASGTQVVVATIAFGMGVDKGDVRGVYHYNLPKGPENYAQEVGRAGRDGRPARCDLFACAADAVTLENFAYGDTPTTEAVGTLLADVLGRGSPFDLTPYDLSNDHDVRPLVVQTLLTYLELEGVIAATGPFYAEYKFQFLRPAAEVLARFDADRAGFLERLFGQAREGRVWRTLEPAKAADALGEPRDRLVKALNYLEEQGDLRLQVAGVRQGYRLTADRPDLPGLTRLLAGRFADREAREVARVARVLEFLAAPGCLTRRLQAYFGEQAEGHCGHCGPCLGEPSGLPPAPPPRVLGPREHDLIAALRAEDKPALAGARPLARFLCGLASPATTRTKLTRHPSYGTLAGVPFAQVLRLTGGGRDRDA